VENIFFGPNFFRQNKTDIGCSEEDREFNSESNHIRFKTGVSAGREKLSPQGFPLRIHIHTCRWQCRKKLLFSGRVFFLEGREDIGCGEEDRGFNSESNDMRLNTGV
jgi:hypothetical protein